MIFPYDSLLGDIIPELQSIISEYYKINQLSLMLIKYENDKNYEGYYVTLTGLADEGCELYQKKLIKEYALGHDKRQDYKITFDYYKSNSHKSYSCNYLGWIYMNALISVADSVKAKGYFKKSAKMNNPVAMYNLAYFFWKYDRLELLKKASELGLANASCFMGSIYMSGKSVKIDEELAIKYYELCVEQDYCDSATIMEFIMSLKK